MSISGKGRAPDSRALLGRHGQAEIVSATGAAITLSSALSSPGYSPVDLLYASVAGCLVLSVRIAASEMRLIDRLVEVRAEVKGRKAPHEPPRIAHLDIRIEVDGEFDDAERHALIERGEELCTVSNTLKNSPQFVVTRG